MSRHMAALIELPTADGSAVRCMRQIVAYFAFASRVFAWSVLVVASAGAILPSATPANAATSVTPDQRAEVLSRAAVTLTEAMQSAEDAYGGFAVEGGLQEKAGMYYYQIDVITKKGAGQVYVNPANGLVIGGEFDHKFSLFRAPDNDNLIMVLTDAGVTLQEAVSIALRHFTGIVLDVRLQEKLGRYFYEIGLINGDTEKALQVAIDNGEVVTGDTAAKK